MRHGYSIFVNATGAYGNVGDAVIRRRAIGWVRDPQHAVHIYVGNAPQEWIDQLDVKATDTVYRAGDRFLWLRRLLLGSGGRALLLDPGEVELSRRSLPMEAFWLVVSALLDARRCPVIRPPRGAARETRPSVVLHRLACRASTVAYWRDAPSLRLVGAGAAAPDIAFQDPPATGPSPPRTKLVVSLRAARPVVRPEWIAAVTAFATEHQLTVVLASQVRSDEPRCVELSARAPWVHLEWPPDLPASQRETELRALYAESRLVLSDRLHVLILAATGGAVPLELVDGPSGKVERTFAQVGIEGVSVDASGQDTASLQAALARATASDADNWSSLSRARERVHEVEGYVARVLAEARAGGRRG